jgi:hypothetical protein
MLSYLEKYNSLDKGLKDKVSSPDVLAKITDLEAKYKVSLATVIMRVMVKEILFENLVRYFNFENEMDYLQAKSLAEELDATIFNDPLIREYLGLDQIKEDPVEKWMEYRHREAASRGSDFFYSPEDEEEMKHFSRKAEEMVSTERSSLSIESKIEAVMESIKINFSSQDLERRFRQLLKTYLLGIRSRIDTKQALVKAVESGGLRIESSVADQILKSVDLAKSGYLEPPISQPAPPKLAMPEDELLANAEKKPQAPAGPNLHDAQYDFNALIAKKKKEVEEALRELNEAAAHGPVQSEKTVTAPAQQRSGFKLDLKNLPDPALATMPEFGEEKDMVLNLRVSQAIKPQTIESVNVVQLKRPQREGRVIMEDVKHMPKLIGPVDELRTMDTVNFRRLNKDPKLAAEKIIQKLRLLEEDGYAKRLEGVKAWRTSPVNRLYLDIGQESMSAKKDVGVVIDERNGQGKDYLTRDEFNAIMDLNRSIRF